MSLIVTDKDVNPKNTALSIASRNGYTDIVALIKGSDINLKNSD
jgi:hypothetical protein